MIRIGRKIAIIGITALAVAGGGTAAAAVMSRSPVGSTGVIHGCWSNKEVKGSHVLVLQDSGTVCPRDTTAISWNETGPQGAVGPVGPQGPPSGAGEIEEHANTTVSYGQNPGSVAQAFVDCPQTYTAISGGYAYQNYLNAAVQEDWIPVDSYAVGNPGAGQTSGWDVVVQMSGTPYTGGGNWQLRTFVYCLPTT